MDTMQLLAEARQRSLDTANQSIKDMQIVHDRAMEMLDERDKMISDLQEQIAALCAEASAIETAKDKLKATYPDRTYWSAVKEVTDFGERLPVKVKYQLIIQPGFDGRDCQLISGDTLALAFQAATDTWNPHTRSDDNNE